MIPLAEPDLRFREDFLSDPDALFAKLLQDIQWDERMKARKTASFGEPYNYSGITYPRTEMPALLEPICDAIAQELGFRPNNCLINDYPDGNASMGYHADATEGLQEGTGIVVISLGAERSISFRNIQDQSLQQHYPLKKGTLLYMSIALQKHWKHAIPKLEGAGERISLTFREILPFHRSTETL